MKELFSWFKGQKWVPQDFQIECWTAYSEGKNGMLHAPTGSGKTYALWGAILQETIKNKQYPLGLQVLWITPLRALATEIQKATQRMTTDLCPGLKVELRTGDSPQSERTRQKRSPSFGLITTPESLHVLISNKEHKRYFENLQIIVVDEWHELLGSKGEFKLNSPLHICVLFCQN